MNVVQTASAERDDTIDVLRAISVIIIIIQHGLEVFVNMHGGGSAANRHFLHVYEQFEFGRGAVALFFFISGFVVPFSLRKDAARGPELISFGVRRLFRLYPAYWVSIVLWVGVISLFFEGRQWAQLDTRMILTNFTMLQRFFGIADVEGLYWTLAMELAFYVACALLFALGWLHRGVAVALVAGALPFLFTYPFGPLPSVVMEIAEFLPMMFAGLLVRRSMEGTASRFDQFVLLGLILYATLWMPFYGTFRIIEGGESLGYRKLFSYAGATVIFLLGLFVFKWRNRPLAWVGRASYALYLFHPVAIYSVATLYNERCMPVSSVIVPMTLVGLITLVFAAIIYERVELPMIDVGRAAVRRILRKPAQSRAVNAEPSVRVSIGARAFGFLRTQRLWLAGALLCALTVACVRLPQLSGVAQCAPIVETTNTWSVGADSAEMRPELLRGWSTVEGAGDSAAVWTLGQQSTLRLFRVSHAPAAKLRVRGNYFAEQRVTSVTINGESAGDVNLSTTAIDVPPAQQHRRVLDVSFRHDGAQSPYSRGISEDRRVLGFFLQEIAVEAPTP